MCFSTILSASNKTCNLRLTFVQVFPESDNLLIMENLIHPDLQDTKVGKVGMGRKMVNTDRGFLAFHVTINGGKVINAVGDNGPLEIRGKHGKFPTVENGDSRRDMVGIWVHNDVSRSRWFKEKLWIVMKESGLCAFFDQRMNDEGERRLWFAGHKIEDMDDAENNPAMVEVLEKTRSAAEAVVDGRRACPNGFTFVSCWMKHSLKIFFWLYNIFLYGWPDFLAGRRKIPTHGGLSGRGNATRGRGSRPNKNRLMLRVSQLQKRWIQQRQLQRVGKVGKVVHQLGLDGMAGTVGITQRQIQTQLSWMHPMYLQKQVPGRVRNQVGKGQGGTAGIVGGEGRIGKIARRCQDQATGSSGRLKTQAG